MLHPLCRAHSVTRATNGSGSPLLPLCQWFTASLSRGLNRNHDRRLKEVFKGAATAATARPGPLQDFYHGMLARGIREELARVTLTRKLAALTLRLWKKGERYDPAQLTIQAR